VRGAGLRTHPGRLGRRVDRGQVFAAEDAVLEDGIGVPVGDCDLQQRGLGDTAIDREDRYRTRFGIAGGDQVDRLNVPA
jgi:hypothetical protein